MLSHHAKVCYFSRVTQISVCSDVRLMLNFVWGHLNWIMQSALLKNAGEAALLSVSTRLSAVILAHFSFDQMNLNTLCGKRLSLLLAAQQAAKVHLSNRAGSFLPECFPGRSGQRADTRHQASRRLCACVSYSVSGFVCLLSLCTYAFAHPCFWAHRGANEGEARFLTIWHEARRKGLKSLHAAE